MQNVKEKEKGLEISNEQEIILEQLSNALNKYFLDVKGDKVDREEFEEISEKINDLKKDIESRGLEPIRFLLWHRLNGSGIFGVEDRVDLFDTPESDIEKFILETFAKYL